MTIKRSFNPAREGNLPNDSKVKYDQIRTIDKARILKEIGRLSTEYIMDIEIAVRKHIEI